MGQLLLERFSEQTLAGFFLVLARLTPLFLLAPMFSSRLVPGRVRGLVAVALAVGLTPVVVGGQEIPLAVVEYTGLLLKELLIGLAFSFTLAALFAAVTVAGTFIDTLIGFSFGALVDPVNGAQSSVLARLYTMLGVLVFIAIGGDAWVLGGFERTYDIVGVLEMPSLASMVAGADEAFVGIFLAAVQIAGPIMLALILTDVAFGLVSRVVPQLNVFAVGFPAKVVVGMLLLGITLPFVGGWLADEVQTSVSEALRTLRLA